MKIKIILVAFLISFIALFGSLYFSLILKLVPCTLCWYQRICMYPLAIILPIALKDKYYKIIKYVLPFSIVGLLISLYHSLLVWGIIGKKVLTCSVGESCATVSFSLFGFLTIPLMSLIAFTAINLCMVFLWYLQHQERN